MTTEKRLIIISSLILLGLSSSIIYHIFLVSWHGPYYPYNTFLCCPWDHFNDFYYHTRYAPDPYHLNSPDPNHLPFLYIILNLLKDAPKSLLFLTLVGSFGITFIFWTTKHLTEISAKKRAFFSLILFVSFPVIFALDRGNFELVIFVFLCLFVTLYYSHHRLSLLFLCLATLIKPFPAIFFVLLIGDKRYKDILWALVFIATVTIISFGLLPGRALENILLYLQILKRYEIVYEAGQYGLPFNSSLFGAIRYVILTAKPQTNLYENYMFLKYPYMLLAGIIAIGIITVVIRFETVFWKKLLFLCLLMILGPFVSANYRMLRILIPAIMFLGSSTHEKSEFFYLITFGILFIPKDYSRLNTFPDVSIAVLIDPLIMIIIAVLTSISAIKKTEFFVSSSKSSLERNS